jgi:hypothetical protein
VTQLVSSRRARLTAGLGALLAACGGVGACSGGALDTRDGAVIVTDPSGAPVPGATVRADPVVPKHPLNLGDYFRSEPDRLGLWQTGADGRVGVKLLSTRPTSVSAVAPGFLPASKLIDPSAPSEVRLELPRVDVPTSPGTGNPR